MIKKLALLIAAISFTVVAHAQFQSGKVYVGASLTGLDLHYSGNDKLSLGVEGKVGLTIMDNVMLLGQVGFHHQGNDDYADRFELGASGRYYIIQNGLYLGAGAKLIHANKNYNDVMPGLEVGYAFFVNRSVTVEPAIYYDHSFKNSDFSTVGLKVGIGIYLFDD
jgi:hypothetical protein